MNPTPAPQGLTPAQRHLVEQAAASPIQPAVGGMTDDRAKFNIWARDNGLDTHLAKDGDYFDAQTAAAWFTWQAALLASTSPRPTAAGWLEALRELLEAEEAPYPPAMKGQDAQTAWVHRQHRARERAREILAASPAQTGEPVTCGHGCACLTDCGDYYASNGLPKPVTGGVDQAWVGRMELHADRLEAAAIGYGGCSASAEKQSRAALNAIRKEFDTHLSTALGAKGKS